MIKVNIVKEFKNIGLLNHFLTEMGQIKPMSVTGLSVENQKRMVKAVLRARCSGIIPYTYRIEEKTGIMDPDFYEKRYLKKLRK